MKKLQYLDKTDDRGVMLRYSAHELAYDVTQNAVKIIKSAEIYDLLITIKYNTSPVIKGKGSVIFLHITDDRYKATKGCIAISKKDFLKILPSINKKTKITIG